MDTRRPSLVPEQFGPLQGVRILSTGTIVALPFAASLAAETSGGKWAVLSLFREKTAVQPIF